MNFKSNAHNKEQFTTCNEINISDQQNSLSEKNKYEQFN